MQPQNGQYIVEVRDGRITDSKPYDPSEMGEFGGLMGIGIWIALGIGILVALLNTFFIVRQQNIAIIERLGRFVRTASPGLNFKIPFIERVVSRMDLRTRELSEAVVVKSQDNAFLRVPVKVQFQIIPESAKDAFYVLEDAEDQMNSYIVNVVRSVAAGMDMEEVFKSKDVFEEHVKKSLSERFGGFGFDIVNVLVDNPIPSEEVVKAFDRVIASKREKEAATNEAEAIRIKTVANATAEAESLTLKAKAYVEQRTLIAAGMAGIIPPEALGAYLVGIDWRDTVRDAADKGAVIMVPTPHDGIATANTVAALTALKR